MQKRTIKCKMKHFRYTHTQELYEKNPSILVKYIREGVTWTEEEVSCITSEDINSFYTELWDPTPDITIPFKPTTPANKIACK